MNGAKPVLTSSDGSNQQSHPTNFALQKQLDKSFISEDLYLTVFKITLDEKSGVKYTSSVAASLSGNCLQKKSYESIWSK